ncbi:MAG: sulfatase [Deltaproteobacteria bacterium]|nr:sulfatase [Deltaproteobacteria bacterium]MBW2361884.1 sulfatase [Deltaproteobacteria bacterium]
MASVLVAALGCGAFESVGPHVVLVTIDTLRADRLGIYGYERDTSPHIDRFFARGSVFENASSSAPCTNPSVRQYLGGAFDYDVKRDVLAELLSGEGYRTAAVVSQHIFYQSLDRYRRGFDHFDIQGRAEVNWKNFTTRTASEVTDRSLAWLSENADAEKIFLWVHYFDPHDPYEPPPAYQGFDAGNGSSKHGDVRRYAEPSDAGDSELFDAKDIAHFRNLYDGEIQFVDAEIGRLLEGLEEAGIVQNAIVALSADHGEWLWEQERWGHCTGVSDSEVRVPLLLRVNGRPLEGRGRIAEPSSTLDLLPTLASLLGIEIEDEAYHGVDLRAAPPERVVVSMWSREIAVRDAEWKLVLEKGVPRSLYWTSVDREERWNRLADRPEPRSRLLERAAPYVGLHRRMHLEGVEDALRDLGYIQ